MHGQMPQEIEVWYIIPALRRELAKSMINGLKRTQKEVAAIMGLTEAAVSQYLHSKRAKEVVFTKAVLDEIRKSAKTIEKNEKLLMQEMMRLTNLTGVKHIMCDLHKKHDSKMPSNCGVCFEEEVIQIK